MTNEKTFFFQRVIFLLMCFKLLRIHNSLTPATSLFCLYYDFALHPQMSFFFARLAMLPYGVDQGLLQLHALVCLLFYKRAAHFYE